jgi:hypothetical protein
MLAKIRYGRPVAALTLFAAVSLGFAIPTPAQVPQPAADGSLNQAIAWMQEAKRNYQGAIRDYTCILVSRENMKGKPSEDQFIQFKFRAQPFSVHMKWLGPKGHVGQEVTYVQGKNNDKLRAHSKTLLNNMVGFVSVDVDDPRVKEQSRHTIREAGIGNLIDRTIQSWDHDRRTGKTIVRIAEFKFDSRDCYRIENIRPEKTPQVYSHRSVIYLEKNSKYPIRNENYFWPVAGGNPGGELMESFSYTQLQFNVGLKDQDFDR